MTDHDLGPIDYLALEFPGAKLSGEGLAALVDLVDRGIIRTSTSGFFSLQTLRNAPDTFVGMIAILVLAVALDLVWSRLRKARLAELEAP